MERPPGPKPHEQCDQMTGLVVRCLTSYNSENLPISLNIRQSRIKSLLNTK